MVNIETRNEVTEFTFWEITALLTPSLHTIIHRYFIFYQALNNILKETIFVIKETYNLSIGFYGI